MAGSLFVAGLAAYASVQAVAPKAGETVVVSAAAGGVGSVAVQLARRTGARVIGLAGERNHDWLRRHDIVPVTYGDGQAERIREAAGGSIDAFIDTFGGGYVDLAIELGVAPQRINTIADFEAVQRLGVSGQGTHAIATAALLAELVGDGRQTEALRYRSPTPSRWRRFATPTASWKDATPTERSCCCPELQPRGDGSAAAIGEPLEQLVVSAVHGPGAAIVLAPRPQADGGQRLMAPSWA